MSEHQVYEFVALDRPLTAREMAELRAISTRAEITPTRFWNEYHWGDLKADPAALLARYFDAHLYFANWGSRRLMLRVPAESVDVRALKPCFKGPLATLTQAGRYIVLDLQSDDKNPQEEVSFEGGRLAGLIPLRAQLLQGDRRLAYVAWLGNVQAGGAKGGEREPPVPPGLGALPAPLASLVEFLRVDPDLLAAASEASGAEASDTKALRAWVKALSGAEKDRWLLRAADHPDAPLGAELLATFRRTRAPAEQARSRTVAQLRARAEALRAERSAREERAQALARAAAERARTKRLDRLAERLDAVWADLTALVDGRAYDKAVALALDLHDLAHRDHRAAEFDARFAALRKAHGRRRGFFEAFRGALEGRRPEAGRRGLGP
jgi:hypothetical protein